MMETCDCETEEDSATEANLSPGGEQTSLSNNREVRNRAEKMRRDKLNSYISELSKLVPMVTSSSRKLDKASILRLTASYLRIHNTFVKNKQMQKDLPIIDQMILEQLVTEQMAGFLLLLTTKGKIIFVSHAVEKLLGHCQTEMMGQSVLSFIHSNDHDKFKGHLVSDRISNENWRRYFQVAFARAPASRTESVIYEHVNIMGVSKAPKNHKIDRESLNKNDDYTDLLIFFVSLQKPAPLIDRLIEASKDEYVTQHLLDGRIINCDQRISFVAGYMIEEVSGISAFKFMHRGDVRWAMIALRQMYDKGESVGMSCYRLLSRTGRFIYLRTRGFLKVDSTGTVESFMCINTLMSEKEGKKLIREMKSRFAPMLDATNYESQIVPKDATNVASVEDPQKLDIAIKLLLTNLPSPIAKSDSSSTSSNSSYSSPSSIESHTNEINPLKCPVSDNDSQYIPPNVKRTISTTFNLSEDIYLSPPPPLPSSSSYSSSNESFKKLKISDIETIDNNNDLDDDDDSEIDMEYYNQNKSILSKLLMNNVIQNELHQKHIKC